MEIISNVRSWGNGAGILVPKEWNGMQAKVTIIDRTDEIKKEIFRILDAYLYDIIGIYLAGSYARGEENKASDIDIIAVSTKIKKEITSGKYRVSIYPLDNIKKTLKKNPLMIYPRIIEAKAILNENLLNELKPTNVNKNAFKNFFEDTKRIIRINKELIDLDKIDGEDLSSIGVIYSLVLRLRGLFLIKSLLEQKRYMNKSFRQWLSKGISKENFELVYQMYKEIKEDKKSKLKIKISVTEKLLAFLKKENKKYG